MTVYYRVFNDDGAIPVKEPYDAADNTLGRIHADSVPLPHNVASIKHSIASQEGLPDHYSPSLYLSTNDKNPARDDESVNISNSMAPGWSPGRPMGLMIAGEGKGPWNPNNGTTPQKRHDST